MSDSDKPKLSEIRASVETSPAQVAYLLYLVERMGETLEPLVHMHPTFCDQCVITIDSKGNATHEENCPVPKARALLEELEK